MTGCPARGSGMQSGWVVKVGGLVPGVLALLRATVELGDRQNRISRAPLANNFNAR